MTSPRKYGLTEARKDLDEQVRTGGENAKALAILLAEFDRLRELKKENDEPWTTP